MTLDNTYLKYLIRAHTILGIFVIFFFFISTFFGTITVFKPYIETWESPAKHYEKLGEIKLNLDETIPKLLSELGDPDDRIQIDLPSAKNDTFSAKFGFSQKVFLNPYTNEILDTKDDTNFLSIFFDKFHVNLRMSMFGQILMGLSSISIIFLTITGIYLWLLNRKKRVKVKNTWFRWHKDISLIIFPYIMVFAITGAMLGFMLGHSTPFVLSATNNEETVLSKLVRPIIFPAQIRVKKSEEKVPMESFSKMYDNASKMYPNLNITTINLHKWYDKNAKIVFSGYLKDNRILTGKVNRANIIFNGANGEFVSKKGLEETHGISKVLSGLYFFHFLPDEGIVMRLIYLVLGVSFAICLVFGLLIWLEKIAGKYKGNKNYYHFISKLTIAICIGIVPASTFLIALYWTIPFDTLQRETWLVGLFFSFWSFLLFYSVWQNDFLKSLKLFMFLNALFLFIGVLMHEVKTNYYLWDSFSKNSTEIFWIDFSLILFGLLSLVFVFNISNIKFLDKFKGL